MDPFITLMLFIFSTTAAVAYLLSWFDTRSARARLVTAERKLEMEMLFAPEPWADQHSFDRYETECQNLREEMASIIERHGIHPFDSIKPF